MQQTMTHLLEKLLTVARLLPNDKLAEVLDFASYLQQRWPDPSRPERGTAKALLSHAGTFRLEPGELDRLIADIAQMRELDLESHA